jgi:hypothetical protein
MATALVCPHCRNGAHLVALAQVLVHYPASYTDEVTLDGWPATRGAPVIPPTSLPVLTGVTQCMGCGKRTLTKLLVART